MDNEILNNWGYLLSQSFGEVSDKVLEYTDSLIYSAQIICGLFAFIYIGLKLWKQWAKGETIDFYSYLRPFVICLLIGFFSVLASLFDTIIKPLESVTLNINTEIYSQFNEVEKNYYTHYEQMRDLLAECEREEMDYGNSQIGTTENVIVSSSEEAANVNIFRLVVEYADYILQYVQMAVIYFFPLYVSISKVILLIIGPFMLALSILPGFTGNLASWITHYLRIMMIPAISYLVGSFIAVVNIHCYYTPLIEMLQNVININDNFLLTEVGKDFIFNKSVVGIVVSLITIFIYMQIPKFSNWIIRPDRLIKKS